MAQPVSAGSPEELGAVVLEFEEKLARLDELARLAALGEAVETNSVAPMANPEKADFVSYYPLSLFYRRAPIYRSWVIHTHWRKIKKLPIRSTTRWELLLGRKDYLVV